MNRIQRLNHIVEVVVFWGLFITSLKMVKEDASHVFQMNTQCTCIQLSIVPICHLPFSQPFKCGVLVETDGSATMFQDTCACVCDQMCLH